MQAHEAVRVLRNDICLISGDKDRKVATGAAGDIATTPGTGTTVGTVLGDGAGGVV